MENPTKITVHCSATKNGSPVPAATIDAWHKEKGWKKIGYHFVIQPDGLIEKGRELNEQGAHVEGANEGNIGVCMIGLDKFTGEALHSLRATIGELLEKFPTLAAKELYCHNEFPSAKAQGKTCPGFPGDCLREWYTGRLDALKPYRL